MEQLQQQQQQQHKFKQNFPSESSQIKPVFPKEPQITNILFTFRFNREFMCEREYRDVARFGVNAEYNPRKFHSIVMRMRHMLQNNNNNKDNSRSKQQNSKPTSLTSVTTTSRTTSSALIFRNGKVVVSGARSIRTVRADVRKICQRVNFAVAQRFIGTDIEAYKIPKPFSTIVSGPKIHNVVVAFRTPHRLAVEKLFADLNTSELFKNRITTVVFHPIRDYKQIKLHNCCLDFSRFPALRIKFAPSKNLLLSVTPASNKQTMSMNGQQKTKKPFIIAVIIFINGNVIITGARKIENILTAAKNLKKFLSDYER